MQSVRVANDLADALAHRHQLQQGEVFVCPQGHIVDQQSLVFYAPDSEQAGMLARVQEIENLERQLRAQTLLADEARAALVKVESALTQSQQTLHALQRDLEHSQSQAHQFQVEYLRLSQQAQAAGERATQLNDEVAEMDAQLEQLQERRETGQARFDELDIQLGAEQEQQTHLDDQVLLQQTKVAQIREQVRALDRQAQEAQFGIRSRQSRQAELQRFMQTSQSQALTIAQTMEQVDQELAELNDTSAQAGLQEALNQRMAKEQALALIRNEYEHLSMRLRQADEQRMTAERSLQPLREQITQLQLEQQAASLGGAQYLEQLRAAQVDLSALEQSIQDQGVKLWGLQGEIDRINREIQALGAVNLAALDELVASRERKTFLDAQTADLLDAIQTLEGAIQKIDLETRDLLGQTFRQVNEHFGRMFPSLFGGGQARLVMTGDEILDAGVQVMAQPPGKKNSTIHLLSGGEKALTAIALVFAIFQLNPAPFCVLDEVDAPLDDANTERYARLVSQMSTGTQFLFISHNKIAMEMAKQLIGVTMQEQGVSRIVAVDMESALSMAEVV